ncbi:hypothetical protein NA57DRAFT_33486, partial [Rhizodiscina lignyota]
SWKHAYELLSEPRTAIASFILQEFLKDGYAINVLRRWLEPLDQDDAAKAQAKRDFITKTSSASFSHPSANEIKEDASWLAKEITLDELSALRIAILEVRERPIAQLQRDSAGAGVQNVVQGSTFGSSTTGPTTSDLDIPQTSFASKEERRSRLLQTYMSERVHVVKIGDLLQRLKSKNGYRLGDEIAPVWLIDVRASISGSTRTGGAELWSQTTRIIQAAKKRFDHLFDIPWLRESVEYQVNPTVEECWVWTCLSEMNAMLQFLFFSLQQSETIPNAQPILEWFQFVGQNQFFQNVAATSPSQQPAVVQLQALAAVISISIFRLPALARLMVAFSESGSTNDTREFETSFICQTTCIADLQTIFLDAIELGPSPAAPALLLWALLAFMLNDIANLSAEKRRQSIAYDTDSTRSRRESMTADPITAVERGVEVIRMTINAEQPFAELGAAAADRCQAYEVISMLGSALQETLAFGVDDMIQRSARSVMLELLDMTEPTAGYTPNIVAAALALIGGSQRSWDSLVKEHLNTITDGFAKEGSLARRLEMEAQKRYPLEPAPFLQFTKLSTQLSTTPAGNNMSTLVELQRLPTFTQAMPLEFQSYSLPLYDTDVNIIKLDVNLQLFRPKRAAIGWSQISSTMVRGNDHAEIFIPSETQGIVISLVRPLVVLWHHKHSALQYLTNWLSTLVAGSGWIETASDSAISLQAAGEIISLFATFVQASKSGIRESDGSELTTASMLGCLEGLHDPLHSDRDFMNIVFDIFEQQLRSHALHPGVDGSIDLLVSCALFLVGVTDLCPGRVWSFISRSQLLELDGSGGNLVTIVEATEMVNGQYDLVIATIRLFEALVEEAIRSVLARKATRTSTRFGQDLSFDVTPDRSISDILLAFTKTLTGLFGSSTEWRFASIEDKFEMNTSILRVFGKVISYTYGFDDISEKPSKLTAVLNDSAQYIVDAFLTTSTNDLVSRPLLQILVDAAGVPYERLPKSLNLSWSTQSQSALRFLVLLLRTNSFLGLLKPAIESKLIQMTSTNVRLFAACPACRAQMLMLFTELVKSAGRSEKEPPSLFGNIRADAAKSFLALLTDLAQSNESIQTQIAVWDFLSAIISSKQQWFSIFVLTGTSPRDNLKARSSGAPTTKTLFQVALEHASDLITLNPELAVSILTFVNISQNYWPRVIREIRKHPSFEDGVLAYVGILQRNERERDPERLTQSCHETRIASIIAEILAMCLHFARQLGDISVAEKMAPKLSYYKEFGVATPRYNNSLHTNLKKNLEAKYPGCKIHNLKRTDLNPAEFGESFYYDLDFAAKVLDFDAHWAKEQSIRREFPIANVDLSLVEAQMELLNSWKLLASELSILSGQIKLPEGLLTGVIQRCLEANSSTDNPPDIFDRLIQVRADFAFVLLQKLLRTSAPLAEMKPLFECAWTATLSAGVDFEFAFSGSNTGYYRTLLKILFLTLKPHLGLSKVPRSSDPSSALIQQPQMGPTLLGVLDRVVAQGFRSLATQLHEDPNSVNPGDFILITALLQSILRVKDVTMLYTEIVIILTNHNVTRYATNLFSWADQLALDSSSNGPGDPVYGELSVLFLLELSTVQPMAETMAIEAVLAQLSAAKLCQYFQRGQGMGPFDEPVRLFTIWSKGILPLALNLLGAIGAPVAAEIATFLNQFAPQMARNARSLETRAVTVSRRGAGPIPGAITLGLANETHTLALISYGLDRAREAGAAVGVVSSDIPSLEWDAAGVRDDLQTLMNGRKGLADRIVAVTEGEEAIMRVDPVADKHADNQLEEKIVVEFQGALRCLGVENGDGK